MAEAEDWQSREQVVHNVPHHSISSQLLRVTVGFPSYVGLVGPNRLAVVLQK